MSTLETVIWNILGYGTMPLIFLVGFAVTVLTACILLDMLGIKSMD